MSQPNAITATPSQSSRPPPDTPLDDLARARAAYLVEKKSKSYLSKTFSAGVLLRLADEFQVGSVLTTTGRPSQDKQLIASALVAKVRHYTSDDNNTEDPFSRGMPQRREL